MLVITNLKLHVCELINYRSKSVDTLFENILTSKDGPVGLWACGPPRTPPLPGNMLRNYGSVLHNFGIFNVSA